MWSKIRTHTHNMNEIKIQGDKNQVYSQIKNSKINSADDIAVNKAPESKWGTWLAIVIAALTLVATCIIGWNQIVQFLKHKFNKQFLLML